jgi:hypothetical protein
MKHVTLIAAGLAGLALAAVVLLAGARAAQPTEAQRWAEQQQIELQIEQARADAARWRAFWDLAVPVGGALLVLVVLTGGAIAVDAYIQRRRPLVWMAGGAAPVAWQQVIDGQALPLQQAAIAGHYTAAAARSGPHSLHYAPHQVYQNRSEGGQIVDAPPLALAAPAPTFAALLSQGTIGPGRPLITGYSDGQPITAALADWRSGAVAGLPGSGKTTTQRFIAAQAALQGARLVILDPHMHKGADSLAGTLAPLAPAFLCDPAEHPRDMLHALHLVDDIMRARLAGAPVDFPLFVFVDEFTSLMGRSDLAGPLATLIEAIAQEGRASLVQGVVSGQIWTADRAGGSALRDSLASTYVHRLKPGQARVLLPAEDARRVPTLPTGAAVLWRADGSIADVVIPLTTGADMAAVGKLLPAGEATPGGYQVATDWLPAPAAPETGARAPVDPSGTNAAPDVANVAHVATPAAPAEAARAVRLFLAGKDPAEIVPLLRQTKDGRPITSRMGGAYQNALDEVLTMIRDELLRQRAAQ